MGWNDHLDDGELSRSAALRELLNRGCLEGAAAGIARQVIARGPESLSSKQQYVFDEAVKPFLEVECSRCGCPVEDDEVIESWDNGGLCSFCAWMASKDD